MRSTERRKKLLKWLEKDGTLSLVEMVDHFGVSKMTIHRDLEWLEQRQALKRIHGGAARLESRLTQHESGNFEQLSQTKCLICNRPPSQQLLYTITLKNGEQKVACCPHCGISAHLMLGDQVATALTADFLSGRLHSAQHSYFVMEGVVAHCCKPSILTFDDEEMALRFQKGFGGKIGRFNDAMEFLKKDMSLHNAEGCPHCAPVAAEAPNPQQFIGHFNKEKTS
ncbi:MAG: DeoR family transcriptional regulator [Desulforhopalus sp.]